MASSSIVNAGDKLQVGPVCFDYFSVGSKVIPGSANINGPASFGGNAPVGVPRANAMFGPGFGIPVTLESVGITNIFGNLNIFALENILGASNFFGLSTNNSLRLSNSIDLKNSLDIGNGFTLINGGLRVATTIYTPFLSSDELFAENAAIDNTLYAFNVEISGNLSAPSKHFNIKHPSKSNFRLIHSCLEGPENAVYYRGRLINQSEIILPDYWNNLIDFNSITIHLTPRSFYQELFVKKIEDNKFIHIENKLDNNIDCDYIIYSERIDIDKLKVECPEK